MLPKVLIVEDDDAIREIYAMKFELAGFTTEVAENGAEALGKVAKFNPNFILLDMMMPVMSGQEFLERLGPQVVHRLHVIVFSNVAGPRQQAMAKRLGAKDFWVKSDYTPERVTQEVARRWQDITA
jgi:CheY-like chemotaxis protein